MQRSVEQLDQREKEIDQVKNEKQGQRRQVSNSTAFRKFARNKTRLGNNQPQRTEDFTVCKGYRYQDVAEQLPE